MNNLKVTRKMDIENFGVLQNSLRRTQRINSLIHSTSEKLKSLKEQNLAISGGCKFCNTINSKFSITIQVESKGYIIESVEPVSLKNMLLMEVQDE